MPRDGTERACGSSGREILSTQVIKEGFLEEVGPEGWEVEFPLVVMLEGRECFPRWRK